MKSIYICIIVFRLLKHSDEPPTLMGGTTLLLGEGHGLLCPPAGYGPALNIHTPYHLNTHAFNDFHSIYYHTMPPSTQGARKEGPANVAKAASDAEALYRAGEAKWGTDESEFLRLLCAESLAHLRAVFDAYAQAHHKSIEQVIESEFSGNLKTALLAIGTFLFV